MKDLTPEFLFQQMGRKMDLNPKTLERVLHTAYRQGLTVHEAIERLERLAPLLREKRGRCP